VFHVILYQPEIPPNTGNIIRLCANSGCLLHLIGPLGFDLDRKSVRRAGLDYVELTNVTSYRRSAIYHLASAPAAITRRPAISRRMPSCLDRRRVDCHRRFSR